MSKKIAVLIGSNSQTSLCKLVVKHLEKVKPADLDFNIVPIGHLPLYDRDLDSQNIESYNQFREQIRNADAVIWVTPEHNGAMSAILKNAIDIGSRPVGQGQSAWLGKPLGIVTLGASISGGIPVADQLRNIASRTHVSMPTYQQSACIASVLNGVFNENGEIINELVKDLLQRFINGYGDFIKRF